MKGWGWMPRTHRVEIKIADLEAVQTKIGRLSAELEAMTEAARELADLAGYFWAHADVPGNLPEGDALSVFNHKIRRMADLSRQVRGL